MKSIWKIQPALDYRCWASADGCQASQLISLRRRWRRRADHFAVSPVSRCVLDAATGRLQLHVDDPLVEHLAKRTQYNDDAAAGIGSRSESTFGN